MSDPVRVRDPTQWPPVVSAWAWCCNPLLWDWGWDGKVRGTSHTQRVPYHPSHCLPPPPPRLPPHLCPGQVFCTWTYITSEQVQGRLSLPLFCQGEDAVGEEEGDEEGSLHGPRAVNEPLPGALLTMTVEAQSMAMVELQLSSPSVGDAAAVQINAQVRRGAFPRLHFPPLPPPCCLSLLPTAPPPNLHNREYSHTVLGGGPL